MSSKLKDVLMYGKPVSIKEKLKVIQHRSMTVIRYSTETEFLVIIITT
jgi:hypothetical protein